MIIALQIVDILFTIIGLLQKKKEWYLVSIIICNLSMLVAYAILNQIATVGLIIIAILRTIIFYIYSTKKLKPNLFVLLAYEACYIVICITMWQGATTLASTLVFMIATYGMWQDNMTILRATALVSGIINIVFRGIIGAYISMASCAIGICATIISIVYYDILGRTTSVFKRLRRCFIKRKPHTASDLFLPPEKRGDVIKSKKETIDKSKKQ